MCYLLLCSIWQFPCNSIMSDIWMKEKKYTKHTSCNFRCNFSKQSLNKNENASYVFQKSKQQKLVDIIKLPSQLLYFHYI